MLDAPAFFADVDNPGRWSEFVFQPKYGAAEKGRSKKYVGHVTPAGAKVVPMNDDGIRKKKVFYRGWKPDEFDATNFCRGMANKDCMKPADRKGLLDANRLQQLRLTAERMKCDPLFFLQLLPPFCDPKRSGVDGDGRMPFFTNASIYTNGYAVMEKGLGRRVWARIQARDRARIGTVAWCADSSWGKRWQRQWPSQAMDA